MDIEQAVLDVQFVNREVARIDLDLAWHRAFAKEYDTDVVKMVEQVLGNERWALIERRDEIISFLTQTQ